MQTFVRILSAAVVVLLVTLLLAQAVPLLLPQRDSGVFLYIGQRILAGDAPYRELWDHKGPLLYLINALGILLAGSWGVWAIQFVLLLSSCLALMILLTRLFGPYSAIVSIILAWSMFFKTFEGGNLTEVYAVPLQVVALWLGANATTPLSVRWWRVLGAVLAGMALLRPNNTGTGLVILVWGLFATSSMGGLGIVRGLRESAVGFALVTVPVLGYLAINSALGDFVALYFTYNFFYAGLSQNGSFSDALSRGLSFLNAPGIWILVILGAISTAQHTFRNAQTGSSPGLPVQSRVTVVACLALLVELLLATVSGIASPHYFMMCIVSLTVLACAGLHYSWALLGKVSQISAPLKSCLAGALVLVLLQSPVNHSMALAAKGAITANYASLVQLRRGLRAATTGHDFLLVWGAETRLNYLANRVSPSKFNYQYPLMQCGYSTPAQIAQFTHDLRTSNAVIIDASSTNHRILPLDRAERRRWLQANDSCGLARDFAGVLELIDTQYRERGVLPGTRWRVLQRE